MQSKEHHVRQHGHTQQTQNSLSALVEQHLRLVPYMVGPLIRKWNLSQADQSDVMGAGYLGLCIAAEKFDAARGVTFSTYACATIYGTAQKALFREVRNDKAEKYGVSVVSLDDQEKQTGPNVAGNVLQTRGETIASPQAAESFSLVEAEGLWTWAQAHLPPDLYETMYLHIADGLPIAKVAERQNITRQSVNLRMRRALIKLRAAIKNAPDTSPI